MEETKVELQLIKMSEIQSQDNDELLYTLQVIAITLDGLKGEDE